MLQKEETSMSLESVSNRGRYLLLVGIGDYRDQTMPKLPGVIHDVNRLYSVLRQFGNLPLARTVCLYNEQATREAILRELADLAAKARQSDQVVVYFGGHGCHVHGGDSRLPDGMTRYLLPYDASFRTAAATAISTATLAESMVQICADELVLIIDCCEAGGLAGVFSINLGQFQQSGRSCCLFAAATACEEALDTCTFTQAFCDALQGREGVRASASGLVSASAAYAYAEEEVGRTARLSAHIQNPVQFQFGHEIQLSRLPVPTVIANGNGLRGSGGVAGWLAAQLKPWFEALSYQFESHVEEGEDYFEWIVDVPARRGFDRVVVRGLGRQVRVTDVQSLRQSVQHTHAHEGWLVAVRLIDPPARKEAKKQAGGSLFCYTLDELIEEQVKFDGYFDWLEEEVKRRLIDTLYVPLACTKPEFHPVTGEHVARSRYGEDDGWIEGYINVWLEAPGNEHVSILGDFGAGKTWFVLRYAWEVTKQYRQAKMKGLPRPRIPLVIPLRDYAKAVTVESLFSEFFFRRYDIRLPGYRCFDQLNRMGRLLLLFDGFDEMAVRLDRQKMVENFRELARVVVPGSKAILTCRTEHFPDIQQATEVLNRGPVQFDLLELEHFDPSQIRKALSLRTTSAVVDKIMADDHLLDFARRPVMIGYLIEALPQIESGKPVDLSRVYLYALQREMERNIEEKRTFTSEADKFYFFSELSWEMLTTGQMRLNFRDFPDRVRQLFEAEVRGQKDLDHWENDLRRNGILVRNEAGDYIPAHRSLLEFFAAYKFVALLGIMADDFLEPARRQSHVRAGASGMAESYLWQDYFLPKLDAHNTRMPIKPLKNFAPVPLKDSEEWKTLRRFASNSNLLVFAAGMVSSEPECIRRVVDLALYEGGPIAWLAQSFLPYLKHRDHAVPLARGVVEKCGGGPLPSGVTWALGELGVLIPEVEDALWTTIKLYAQRSDPCSEDAATAGTAWWESAFALEKLGVLPAGTSRQGDAPMEVLAANLPKDQSIEELKQRLKQHLERNSADRFSISECDAVLIVKHEAEPEVLDLFRRSLGFIDFAREPTRRRCYRMVWLCGHLGGNVSFQDECLRSVLAATVNPYQSIRNSALEALGKIGIRTPEIIEAVEKGLEDEYYRSRYHAAWALGQLQSTGSLVKLNARLWVEQVLDVRRELIRVRDCL